MWAQLIKMRVQAGKEELARRAFEALHAAEQPGSGLIRSTVLRDQKDQSVLYVMVLFESEEKARAREQDPRRREGLRAVGAIMSEAFEPGRDFVDLEVLEEFQP